MSMHPLLEKFVSFLLNVLVQNLLQVLLVVGAEKHLDATAAQRLDPAKHGQLTLGVDVTGAGVGITAGA